MRKRLVCQLLVQVCYLGFFIFLAVPVGTLRRCGRVPLPSSFSPNPQIQSRHKGRGRVVLSIQMDGIHSDSHSRDWLISFISLAELSERC